MYVKHLRHNSCLNLSVNAFEKGKVVEGSWLLNIWKAQFNKPFLFCSFDNVSNLTFWSLSLCKTRRGLPVTPNNLAVRLSSFASSCAIYACTNHMLTPMYNKQRQSQAHICYHRFARGHIIDPPPTNLLRLRPPARYEQKGRRAKWILGTIKV